jgi:predicted RecB family nuclease
MANKGILKVCSKGHQYYKSSDCPTCPICEQERKPKDGFLSVLPAPARRALETAGIKTLRALSGKRESEILKLHGMGPSSIPKLRAALQAVGLTFKKDG